MISAGTLDWLRGIAEGFMPDTAAIARYTETNTADGVVQAWTEIATVACRVSRTSAAGTERAGEQAVLRAVSDWIVYVPWDTDVTERDRITVDGPSHAASRTFEVQISGSRTYEGERRCDCALVT